MSTRNQAKVAISAGLARRAQAAARRRSASIGQIVDQALRRFLSDEDERQFLKQFRRSAKRKGITSQRAVAKLVDNARRQRR
ncbi:MAG TPA: hypothetical protein VJC05_03595 [Candidatus Andersenbacteria bacterium]|nr:hypothetical protein [Candidatus Andersenbacteria bacterium]